MRVALIVDNPLRDLPGLVLVARRLCLAGATCHLVPMNLQDTEVRALAPDAVVVNYLQANNQELVRQLLEAQIAVFVLDTEGVLPDVESYGAVLAPDPDVRHGIAAFCSWGPRFAEQALARGWFQRDQLVVTGAPRFDYYAPELRQAALAASPYAAGAGGPMVLVNGVFPIANPRFQSSHREVRELIERFGYAPSVVEGWRDAELAGMTRLTAAVNHLAERLPEISFVYRPHPFEGAAAYHGLLDTRDNVRLSKQGTVDGWILRAAAVVQRSCTTAIEAGIAGVPAFSPHWIPAATEIEMAEAVSIPVRSEEELEGRLRDILSGRHDTPKSVSTELAEVLSHWFLRIDGRAHERVAEVVLSRTAAHERGPHVARCRRIGGSPQGASLAERTVGTLRAGLKRQLSPTARSLLRPSRPSWDRSEKRFGASQVAALLEVIPLLDGAAGAAGRIEPALAGPRGDYARGLRHGRAVTLAVTPKGSR